MRRSQIFVSLFFCHLKCTEVSLFWFHWYVFLRLIKATNKYTILIEHLLSIIIFYSCSKSIMSKITIMVWAILGFNIWSVFGRTFCGSPGQCHWQIDKRAENQLLKPLSVFKKHHKSRQYKDIPIPKELVYPRNTIIDKIGRFMYPVRVRISRSQFIKHLKSRKGKDYNQSKIPIRRKPKYLRAFSHYKNERLRRTMDYTYR